MVYRIENSQRNSSFATPGEAYVILASSAALRTHLTDSYWCTAMEQVCEGKLQGVAVRYTGENLVLLQFRPDIISPAGYRYPLYMSIPIEFMVPVCASTLGAMSIDTHDSFGTTSSSVPSTSSSLDGQHGGNTGPSALPKLCVVCGRFNMPAMAKRKNGWKCQNCVGQKSLQRLRNETAKLWKVKKGKAT